MPAPNIGPIITDLIPQALAAGFGALGGAWAAFLLARYEDARKQRGKACMLLAEMARVAADLDGCVRTVGELGSNAPRWEVPLLSERSFAIAAELAADQALLARDVMSLHASLVASAVLWASAGVFGGWLHQRLSRAG